MFIIDLRNALVSNYRFSVIGNNDVDEVQIFSHFTQYESYSCYLKVMSADGNYADKISIDNEHKEVIEDALLVKWTMSKDFTQFNKIKIQLQFENSQGEEVAQSRIIDITLNDTLPVEKKVEKKYPHILEDLEKRVAVLEEKVRELEGR